MYSNGNIGNKEPNVWKGEHDLFWRDQLEAVSTTSR